MKNITVLIFTALVLSAGALRAQAPAAGQSKPEAAAPAAAQPVDPYEEALGKLKADSAVLRRQGVVYLAQLRDPKTAPYLTAALADKAAPVRRAAADALGLLAWRDASPKLCDLLLKDPDAMVRQQAAISLSYLLDQASGPALVKALGDASAPVRYAAVHTLGALRYKPAEAPIAALLEDADAVLRRSAISALGMLQSTSSVAAILPALNHKDIIVRVEAARALGDIGMRTATPDLTNHLAEAEAPAVRVECALALAKLGVFDGLPVAREYLTSPDLGLKGQALAVVAAARDLDSLPLIEKLYAAETDPSARGMLDFARQRLLDLQAERKAAVKK